MTQFMGPSIFPVFGPPKVAVLEEPHYCNTDLVFRFARCLIHISQTSPLPKTQGRGAWGPQCQARPSHAETAGTRLRTPPSPRTATPYGGARTRGGVTPLQASTGATVLKPTPNFDSRACVGRHPQGQLHAMLGSLCQMVTHHGTYCGWTKSCAT